MSYKYLCKSRRENIKHNSKATFSELTRRFEQLNERQGVVLNN